MSSSLVDNIGGFSAGLGDAPVPSGSSRLEAWRKDRKCWSRKICVARDLGVLETWKIDHILADLEAPEEGVSRN